MSLSGTIKGASSVVAEIDKVYVNQFQGTDATGGVGTVINAAAITQIQSDLTSLMTADAGLATDLTTGLTDGNGNYLTVYNASSNPTGTFHLRPGAVVEQSTGDKDITLATDWNLTSWRFGSGNEPGTLTLRAAGNLNINASIYDAPTTVGTLRTNTAKPSWNIDLVAGANTQSANPMAVIPANITGPTAGALTIASQKVVYTESGSIGFASGGNTVINDPASGYTISHSYNIGTFSGPILGDVRGNLTLAGGAIQSSTGDIGIDIGGNLTLGWGSDSNAALGAIRTSGQASGTSIVKYATYGNGGSISLDVGGDVDGDGAPRNLSSSVWLAANSVLPDIASGVQGIVAMAGGNVFVRAGGGVVAQLGAFG
jgi:hypothetical protein